MKRLLSSCFSKSFIPAMLAGMMLLAGCSTRSPVASQIINIPPQYADKMNSTLDDMGYQQGLVVQNSFNQYNKAVVYVQLSDPMIENGTLEKIQTGYLFYSDADIRKTILDYANDSYGNAFSASQYYTLTDKAGPGTLKITTYITQVVPNDAFFGSLGNIPSPDWIISKPIGMALHYYGNSADGAVSIETVVSDSQTGNILAVFATREKGTFALFNMDGFTMSGSGKRMIDTWSLDLVSTLDQLKSGSRNLTAAKVYPLISWIN